jgi:hypothetical protein
MRKTKMKWPIDYEGKRGKMWEGTVGENEEKKEEEEEKEEQ